MKNKIINTILLIIILLLAFYGFFIEPNELEVVNYKIKDKDFIHLIVSNTFSYEEKNFIEYFIDKTIEVSNPVYWLRNDYQNKEIYREAFLACQSESDLIGLRELVIPFLSCPLLQTLQASVTA